MFLMDCRNIAKSFSLRQSNAWTSRESSSSKNFYTNNWISTIFPPISNLTNRNMFAFCWHVIFRFYANILDMNFHLKSNKPKHHFVFSAIKINKEIVHWAVFWTSVQSLLIVHCTQIYNAKRNRENKSLNALILKIPFLNKMQITFSYCTYE